MWLAVLLGNLVDQLVSILILGVGQTFDPQLTEGATFASPAGAVTSILLVLSTGLGGWLAARLAKHEFLLHGILVGGVSLILMLVQSLFGKEWTGTVVSLQIIATLVGGLGGWLSQWVPASQRR